MPTKQKIIEDYLSELKIGSELDFKKLAEKVYPDINNPHKDYFLMRSLDVLFLKVRKKLNLKFTRRSKNISKLIKIENYELIKK